MSKKSQKAAEKQGRFLCLKSGDMPIFKKMQNNECLLNAEALINQDFGAAPKGNAAWGREYLFFNEILRTQKAEQLVQALMRIGELRTRPAPS
jgi:hypothetical protein